MDYKFTYKPVKGKKSYKRVFQNYYSQIIYHIYGSKFFQKLKLDINNVLKGYAEFNEERNKILFNKAKPEYNLNVNVFSISFIDCIENEQSSAFKRKLINIVSKYERGFVGHNPEKKINDVFNGFDKSYKEIKTGHIISNNTKENIELDLIDGISYDYMKGPESHFIIIYTIYPSEYFQSLFQQAINSEVPNNWELAIRPLSIFFKKMNPIRSEKFIINKSYFWTEKLLNEINFQFKSKVIRNLNLGIFSNEKKILFPSITTYECEKASNISQEDELFTRLQLIGYEEFYNKKNIININYGDFINNKSGNLVVLLSKSQSSGEEEKDDFLSGSENSIFYIYAIAPLWALINISHLNRNTIIELRKKVYGYMSKNRHEYFFNKALRIKNKITLNWINFKRISKDFSSKSIHQIISAYGLPKAQRVSHYLGEKPKSFSEILIENAKYAKSDINDAYTELQELFDTISQDKLTKVNMRIQKILIWIAAIGILLAIYSSNSEWYNAWINHYCNYFGIHIPNGPKN